MPKFRIQFSILTILILTALVAVFFASRDSDLASLSMNGSKILPLPTEAFPYIRGRWGLLNPKELPLDRVLHKQCLKFGDLPPAQRATVRGSVSKEMEQVLWSFASRCSVFALRSKDKDRVRAGLSALSMLPNRRDFRDVYMKLGPLKCASSQLEPSSTVFSDVAAFSEPHMAELMNNMNIRDPSGTYPRNFVETGYGIGFVEVGNRQPFVANSNLLLISMRLAKAIEETDKDYRVSQFKISSDTSPGYWLRSDDFDFGELEKQVTGAVQFRAYNIDSEIAKHQRFVVDVYEFANPEAPKRLQEIADSMEPRKNKAICAASFDKIFCIIGTQTYVQDGETHESCESLSRFKNPLREEIERIK